MVSRRPSAVLSGLMAVTLLGGPAGAAFGADPTQQAPGVDGARVDAACRKASDWIYGELKKGLPPLADKNSLHTGQTYKELVLYTLLHAGVVSHDDPEIVKLVKDICDDEFSHTYGAAIRTQALQKFDPVGLLPHLRNCAQFIIDNQGQEGYWGYSDKVELPKIATPTIETKVVSGPKGGNISAGPAATGNTKSKSVIPRRAWGKAHDNSNTQYALLGLAAAMAAGLWPPQDCFTAADKWLTEQQNEDGGWCYGERGKGSYGSMTAGGVSSLSIILRAKGNNEPYKDIRVQKALKWLGDNLNFGGNPKGDNRWHFYWIYAVERAGSTAGVEWFGDRPWYKEGADWLLADQKPNGTFGSSKAEGDKVSDTCWAVLFLRRATRSIVYSGPGSGKEGKK
jgi:hypothetical protein